MTWVTPLEFQPVIVVVDDHDSLRRSLHRILMDAGYTLTMPFATARDALAFLECVTPDLVVMDFSLYPSDAYPDGCEAVKDIVRRWPAIRTALLTGWSPGDDALAGCPPGLPILHKPLGIDALLVQVRAILRDPPWGPQAKIA